MNITYKKYGRKSYIDLLGKGVVYVDKRRTGKIKSLRTPWTGVNEAGIGGLEWGSLFTLGARPGSGKTMFVSQILRDARKLNPGQNFNILEFQMEMGEEQYASRQFSGVTGKKYDELLSAKMPIDTFTMEQMDKYIAHCKQLEDTGFRRDVVNDSLNSKEIEEVIYETYSEYGSNPLIVTLDHSWLIKKLSTEKDKFETIYNTTEMLMNVKKKLPVVVIMITQLNRSIDEPLRRQPCSLGNYPTSSDVFGGDALYQGSDMVGVLSRPFKVDIPQYGPFGYEAKKDDVFLHMLKMRNSGDDNKIIFMRGMFDKQTFIEIPEPHKHRPNGPTIPGKYIPREQRTGGGGEQRPVDAPIGNEL